ncbi:bifunctional glutamate N-acetyltransferase/amino-acid acetyltransferase ArgJ [Melioribacteraceae bacterium 4301-Me]|uniref:bifunctional glutamate N-acetyltransferase/amino-acid acetyltransferase ArgJ n=1 Tax=Pyranulibacter aquaticus TaxID=3163344 RepID=UPI0035985297
MYQFINEGSVTSPKGFKAAGIFCGIKKRKKDLALIVSDKLCNAAAVYTLNKVKAAPLLVSKEITDKDIQVKAVLINSGNANACTGEDGFMDAKFTQEYCADKLNVSPENVLISSTGVIGVKLPVQKVISGIDQIINVLSEKGGIDAAEAIMTTDTKIKSFAVKVRLSNGETTIGAICKGSGMIMPNMATMLAFITTDAQIQKPLLKKLLVNSVNISFNKISVDGETSTNDMVVLLSNGLSGVEVIEGSSDEKLFQKALNAISIEMAKSIVADGEGATKLITINVTGADTQEDADLVGKSLANSNLLKTALYGNDANWGRIMSAAGMSGANFDPAKVSISFDDHEVLLPHFQVMLNEEIAYKILSKKEYSINVNLNGGDFSSTWWTCDFSEEYVKINANYRT